MKTGELHLLMRSLRHNVYARDAVDLALAAPLNASLITDDKRLANAAGRQARIEVV